MLAARPRVRVPRVCAELSTRRLLTLEWLEGARLADFENAPSEARNTIAHALFDAWWRPFSHYGIIHGDPHLGNYSIVGSGSAHATPLEGVNLFDYASIRVFPATSAARVANL